MRIGRRTVLALATLALAGLAACASPTAPIHGDCQPGVGSGSSNHC